MPNIFKYIITIILTAAVVGGGGYYFLNKRASDDKSKLQTEIDELNKKIKDLSASSSSLPSSSSTPLESSASDTTSSSASCGSIYSANTLKNGYIANPVTGNVNTKLVDGVYKSGSITITLVESFIACDNDSQQNAAIILKYNDGGTGFIYYVETLAPRSSSYAPTAWGKLGDRIIMQSLLMSDSIVTAKYLSQGANDPASNPTQETTAIFKVPTSGTSLIKQ